MATVNKPILLDETGKDIASAVREQTQALQTAIQSISIGGGSGGGVSEELLYLPTNAFVATGPFTLAPVNMDFDGMPMLVGTALMIYDPTSGNPTPRYVNLEIGWIENQPPAFQEMCAFISATAEELSNIPYTEQSYINLASSAFVLTVEAGQLSGVLPVPYSKNKPLWLVSLNQGEGSLLAHYSEEMLSVVLLHD
jgi:hypothetical protein